MTPVQPAPNLARDLIRIHKVITRGLKVGIAKGEGYLGSGFPSPEIQIGYAHYAHSLASVLGAHHQGEDQVAFPALRSKILSAPYVRLSAEHHKIEMVLVVIRQAVADLSGGSPKNGLSALVDNLRIASAMWEPHIQIEEHYFSMEAINAAVGFEEQGKLSEAMGKHSQEHYEPPYWVVPFVLFNLEPEDRSEMAATFPPMVINELVPKVWKDKWAPMKPFLLD